MFAKRGLIVSCQAYPEDPLFGSEMMTRMARAAVQGGAVGIRANSASDIRAIKQAVPVPIIGLVKRTIPGSAIYITPQLEDIQAVIEAEADIVALDMTDREGRLETAGELIDYIHAAGKQAMADISVAAEGMEAERLGADYVSTTLSGYTPYSPQQQEPDLQLVRELSGKLRVPLIAEGRIWHASDALTALEYGAAHVVIGTAITRPQIITKRYADRISAYVTEHYPIANKEI